MLSEADRKRQTDAIPETTTTPSRTQIRRSEASTWRRFRAAGYHERETTRAAAADLSQPCVNGRASLSEAHDS